jgi:hypothetical protein
MTTTAKTRCGSGSRRARAWAWPGSSTAWWSRRSIPAGRFRVWAGPTFGEIGKVLEIAARGGKGGGEFLLRLIPLIGPLLVNRVFPPKKKSARVA